MAMSENTLRDNYRRLPDNKLISIATEDATKLRPEALALLRAELEKRGLAEVTEKGIQAQFRVLSATELNALCALLQGQPCPMCKSSAQMLNATLTSKVLSFVVMTTEKKQFAIACPTCLDKLHHDATIYSALLGWWGFPWGIVRTIQALSFNDKMRRSNHSPYPNDLLKAFVTENVGRIEASRDNTSELHILLSRASR